MIESFQIHEVILKTKLTGNKKLMLGIIDDFSLDGYKFYGNAKFIAALCGKKQKSVQTHINKMKKEGILFVVAGNSDMEALCINFEHPIFVLKRVDR